MIGFKLIVKLTKLGDEKCINNDKNRGFESNYGEKSKETLSHFLVYNTNTRKKWDYVHTTEDGDW